MKNAFKIIGTLVFVFALIIFLYTQNPAADHLTLCLAVLFGVVLAVSISCFVTSGLLDRIEKLETRSFLLEEELRRIKQQSSDNGQYPKE